MQFSPEASEQTHHGSIDSKFFSYESANAVESDMQGHHCNNGDIASTGDGAYHQLSINGTVHTPNDSPSRLGGSVSLMSSCARSIAPSRQSAGLCDMVGVSHGGPTGTVLHCSSMSEAHNCLHGNFPSNQNGNMQFQSSTSSDGGQLLFQIPSRVTCMFRGDIDLDDDGLGSSEPDPTPQFSTCYFSKANPRHQPQRETVQEAPSTSDFKREGEHGLASVEEPTSMLNQPILTFERALQNSQDGVTISTRCAGLPTYPQLSTDDSSNPNTQPESIICGQERLEARLRELEGAPRKSIALPTYENGQCCGSDRLYYLDTNDDDDEDEEQQKRFYEERMQMRCNDNFDQDEQEEREDAKACPRAAADSAFPATVPRRPGGKHSVGHRVSFGDVITTTTWVDNRDSDAYEDKEEDNSPPYHYLTSSASRLPRGSEELTGSFAHLAIQRSPHAIYKKLELEFNDEAATECIEEEEAEGLVTRNSMKNIETSPSHRSHTVGGYEAQRSSASTTSSITTVCSTASSTGKRLFPSNASLSSYTMFPVYRDPSIPQHCSPKLDRDGEEEEFHGVMQPGNNSTTIQWNCDPARQFIGSSTLLKPSAKSSRVDPSRTVSGSTWVARQQQKMLLQRRQGTNGFSSKSFSPSPTPQCTVLTHQNTVLSVERSRKSSSSQVAPPTSGLTLLRERKRCLRDEDGLDGSYYRSATNSVSSSSCTSSPLLQPMLRVVEDPNQLSSPVFGGASASCGNGVTSCNTHGVDSIKTTRAAGGVAWVAFPVQGPVEPRQKKRRAEGVEKGKRVVS